MYYIQNILRKVFAVGCTWVVTCKDQTVFWYRRRVKNAVPDYSLFSSFTDKN